jgi:hypothetical protein
MRSLLPGTYVVDSSSSLAKGGSPHFVCPDVVAVGFPDGPIVETAAAAAAAAPEGWPSQLLQWNFAEVHQLRAGSDSTKIQLNQSLRMRKVNFEGKKLNSLESFDGMLLLSENHLQHLQKIAVAAAAAVVAKSVGAAGAAGADDDYDEDLLLLFLHVS